MNEQMKRLIGGLENCIENARLRNDAYDVGYMEAMLKEARATPADHISQARDADPIHALIAAHAEQLEQNDYAYFELAYTRQTGWMAWLCSNSRELDPGRKVLARGQGNTPEGACADALKSAPPEKPAGDI